MQVYQPDTEEDLYQKKKLNILRFVDLFSWRIAQTTLETFPQPPNSKEFFPVVKISSSTIIIDDN